MELEGDKLQLCKVAVKHLPNPRGRYTNREEITPGLVM